MLLLFWTGGGGGLLTQKLNFKQIMLIVICLQCLSLSRYLFHLQFKVFPKWNNISTSKTKKCFFMACCYFFANNCTSVFILLNNKRPIESCHSNGTFCNWLNIHQQMTFTILRDSCFAQHSTAALHLNKIAKLLDLSKRHFECY